MDHSIVDCGRCWVEDLHSGLRSCQLISGRHQTTQKILRTLIASIGYITVCSYANVSLRTLYGPWGRYRSGSQLCQQKRPQPCSGAARSWVAGPHSYRYSVSDLYIRGRKDIVRVLRLHVLILIYWLCIWLGHWGGHNHRSSSVRRRLQSQDVDYTGCSGKSSR